MSQVNINSGHRRPGRWRDDGLVAVIGLLVAIILIGLVVWMLFLGGPGGNDTPATEPANSGGDTEAPVQSTPAESAPVETAAPAPSG